MFTGLMALLSKTTDIAIIPMLRGKLESKTMKKVQQELQERREQKP